MRFTVTNTGSRPGADVPQIYVTLAGKARRLVGWAKPQLQPGESRSITLVADPLVLASFDTARQRWITAPGTIRVELSRSATDPVLTAQTSLSAASYRP
ncbi:fibronectin type III-like domain-contianing protein [Novosphingobium sp.]|uniref:fibronectin type III-like domain-contianing protein n=1 Tax=Novosphingobium sp. TaxID=1874826 RepID=UPI003B52D81D